VQYSAAFPVTPGAAVTASVNIAVNNYAPLYFAGIGNFQVTPSWGERSFGKSVVLKRFDDGNCGAIGTLIWALGVGQKFHNTQPRL
jgi:hypothetical protein